MRVREDDQEFELFKKKLRRLLRLEGLLKELDLELGKSRGYLSNLLSGDTTIAVRFLYELCQKFGWSPGFLFRQGITQPFDDPVAILLSRREQPKLPSCDFLDQLRPRCAELLAGKGEKVPVASELHLLEALEEKRFGDCRAAQDGVEELAFGIVYSLEGLDGPKPRKRIGELAATLALWATIQRQRGFRDLAISAFALAFPLAKSSRDGWALGTCYQRAAYLLRDLGRPDFGFHFLRDAVLQFSGGENLLHAWRCQVDIGCMLGSCELYEESNEAYELALERLPGSDWRFRAGALQGLGVNAQIQGMPERARGFLASAARECRQEDLISGHIKWARAKVELDLGASSSCLKRYSDATELLVRVGSSADLALVCLDYAEALLQLNQQARLAPLLCEIAGWLPKLRANPILCRAFDKVVDLARSARIGLAEIEVARVDVQAAWKRGEAG